MKFRQEIQSYFIQLLTFYKKKKLFPSGKSGTILLYNILRVYISSSTVILTLLSLLLQQKTSTILRLNFEDIYKKL